MCSLLNCWPPRSPLRAEDQQSKSLDSLTPLWINCIFIMDLLWYNPLVGIYVLWLKNDPDKSVGQTGQILH